MIGSASLSEMNSWEGLVTPGKVSSSLVPCQEPSQNKIDLPEPICQVVEMRKICIKAIKLRQKKEPDLHQILGPSL